MKDSAKSAKETIQKVGIHCHSERSEEPPAIDSQLFNEILHCIQDGNEELSA